MGHAYDVANYASNYHPTGGGGGRNTAAPQVPLTSSPYAPVPMGQTLGAHFPVFLACHP